MPPQSNSSALPIWVRREFDSRDDRRRRVNRWRFSIRNRQPLEPHLARSLWEGFVQSHGDDEAAALGEMLAALLERGLLREESRW